MDSTPQYDVIVVGLGCVGLSTAFYSSKQGLKVLGLERYTESGTLGSGSAGHGRIWRYMHTEDRYAQMQAEAVEVWRDIEKRTGHDILTQKGLLYIKKPDSWDFKQLAKYGEVLSAKQINERWPAMRIPDYLSGVFSPEAGVVQVKHALRGTHDLALAQGADLRYNTNVVHIDHEKSIVTLDSGETFQAKTIVVCCGALTDQFYQEKNQFKATKQLINCYFLDDNAGLPSCFLLEDLVETNGIMVFGTVDGEGHGKYKIGNELNEDPHLMLKVMKLLMPSKINKITHVMPCFYSNTENEEFIFERKGNTIYGFGLNGRGFKHMTYHGKRIYHLITKNYQEADKYKLDPSTVVIAKL